jgi:aldehyde:ferredoxin oxidoreductase
LAEGSRRLAARYQAEDIAIHVKGLELPAYDPRGAVGQGLEYATSNRGACHMRGTTVYLEAIGPLSVDPLSGDCKPELVVFAQNLNAAISSLVMCYFSFQGFIPGVINSLKPHALAYRTLMRVLQHSSSLVALILKARSPLQVTWFEKMLAAVIGQPVSFARLLKTGDRIFNLERLYNLREGLDPTEDTLPSRLLNESTSRHGFNGVPLRDMLPRYYRLRGWDPSGRPTEKTVKRLNIRT